MRFLLWLPVAALLMNACYLTTAPADTEPQEAPVLPANATVATPHDTVGCVEGSILEGIILSEDLQVGIAGAIVSIEGTSYSAVTDVDGRFHILSDAEGSHSVLVTRDGFHPYRTPAFQLPHTGTVSLKTNLAPIVIRTVGPPTKSDGFVGCMRLGPHYVGPLLIVDDVFINREVDGVPGISSQPIRTVEFLSGSAAAAVYGQRAANGVIVIKTARPLH